MRSCARRAAQSAKRITTDGSQARENEGRARSTAYTARFQSTTPRSGKPRMLMVCVPSSAERAKPAASDTTKRAAAIQRGSRVIEISQATAGLRSRTRGRTRCARAGSSTSIALSCGCSRRAARAAATKSARGTRRPSRSASSTALTSRTARRSSARMRRGEDRKDGVAVALELASADSRNGRQGVEVVRPRRGDRGEGRIVKHYVRWHGLAPRLGGAPCLEASEELVVRPDLRPDLLALEAHLVAAHLHQSLAFQHRSARFGQAKRAVGIVVRSRVAERHELPEDAAPGGFVQI